MEPDAFALKTGLFLLVAGTLAALTFWFLAGQRLETSTYQIFTEDSVSGLDERSRVYYKGVEVGHVAQIGFAEPDFNTVHILIEVDATIPLGTNTFARLALRGITGEYDLTLDNDGSLGTPLNPSSSSPPTIPMRDELIARIGATLESAVAEVGKLAENMQALTDASNRERVADLLDAFTLAGERLAALSGRADGIIADLGPATDAFTRAMEDIDRAARSWTEETAGLDGLIASLNASTEAVRGLIAAAQGDTLHDVDETLQAMRTALVELTELVQELQQDPQSLLLGQEAPSPGPGERRPGESR